MEEEDNTGGGRGTSGTARGTTTRKDGNNKEDREDNRGGQRGRHWGHPLSHHPIAFSLSPHTNSAPACCTPTDCTMPPSALSSQVPAHQDFCPRVRRLFLILVGETKLAPVRIDGGGGQHRGGEGHVRDGQGDDNEERRQQQGGQGGQQGGTTGTTLGTSSLTPSHCLFFVSSH